MPESLPGTSGNLFDVISNSSSALKGPMCEVIFYMLFRVCLVIFREQLELILLCLEGLHGASAIWDGSTFGRIGRRVCAVP